MMLASVPAVFAAEDDRVEENSYNVIVNKSTGRVISVERGEMGNLARITAEELRAEDFRCAQSDQVWRIAPLGGELSCIVNKKTGRVLDVPDAKAEEGVQLIQYSYNGNSQQKMTIEKSGEAYTISPSHAETYLADVDGKIVQINDRTADNAEWIFKTVGSSLLPEVKSSEGYAALSPELKRTFDNYLYSGLYLSPLVRNNVETLLAREEYNSLSAEKQKRLLTKALSETASGLVMGNILNETSAPYRIVSCERVEDFDIWGGSRCSAWVFEVEMEGDAENPHSFRFATNEESSDAPMVKRCIEALGVFPYAVRKYIKNLYWKKGDNANNFNGGGSSIWIRLNYEPDFQKTAQTFSHELGHLLEQNLLKEADVWKQAESLDACPISSYGSGNSVEDLAEFSRLYWTNFGRESFDEIEKVYPNRTKVYKGMLYRADSEYFKEFEEFEAYIEYLARRKEDFRGGSDSSALDENKLYVIKDFATDKAVTVKDGSEENNVILTLERYNARAEQHFRVEKYGSGIKIISAKSNKPIQLDKSAMSGRNIVQYGGTSAVDEKFAVYEKDGRFRFLSLSYGLYISSFGDTAVQSMEPFEWTLIEYGDTDAVKNVVIRSRKGAELSAEAVMEPIAVKENGSVWKISPTEDGAYKIIDTKCELAMDVSWDGTLMAYPFISDDNQKFLLEKEENGFRLKNRLSGLYVTDKGDGTLRLEEKGEGQIFTLE